MKEKLITLIAELFKMKPEEITDSLTMKDTEVWDSLKHMELIVSIEQTMNISLTFDEIVFMRSVKDIKQVLKQRGIEV